MNKKFIHKTEDPVELEHKITAMRAGGKIVRGLVRELYASGQPGLTGTASEGGVRKLLTIIWRRIFRGRFVFR